MFSRILLLAVLAALKVGLYYPQLKKVLRTKSKLLVHLCAIGTSIYIAVYSLVTTTHSSLILTKETNYLQLVRPRKNANVRPR